MRQAVWVGINLDSHTVVSLEAVDEERHSPTYDEQCNNAVAECPEIIVQVRCRIPEHALQMKLTRDQSKRFDATDYQCHQHRHRCNGQIVEEFAHGISIRPTIGTQHQHTITSVMPAAKSAGKIRSDQLETASEFRR